MTNLIWYLLVLDWSVIIISARTRIHIHFHPCIYRRMSESKCVCVRTLVCISALWRYYKSIYMNQFLIKLAKGSNISQEKENNNKALSPIN